VRYQISLDNTSYFVLNKITYLGCSICWVNCRFSVRFCNSIISLTKSNRKQWSFKFLSFTFRIKKQQPTEPEIAIIHRWSILMSCNWRTRTNLFNLGWDFSCQKNLMLCKTLYCYGGMIIAVLKLLVNFPEIYWSVFHFLQWMETKEDIAYNLA
jgi:hypothetical protein